MKQPSKRTVRRKSDLRPQISGALCWPRLQISSTTCQQEASLSHELNEKDQWTVTSCTLMWACVLCPQAAFQAGLGLTVSNAVTAVTAPCVTLQLETVPAVWAGWVHTAMKVILFFSYCIFYAPARAHANVEISEERLCWFSVIHLLVLPISQNVLGADLVPTASWNVTAIITAPATEWRERVIVVQDIMDICVNMVRTEKMNGDRSILKNKSPGVLYIFIVNIFH